MYISSRNFARKNSMACSKDIDDRCCTCFDETNYICSKYDLAECNKCSTYKNNEVTIGWTMKKCSSRRKVGLIGWKCNQNTKNTEAIRSAIVLLVSHQPGKLKN